MIRNRSLPLRGRAGEGAAVAIALALSGLAGAAGAQVAPYKVSGDAIEQPLAEAVGDAARGRAIVANRQQGLCLLCHSAPIPEERFQGDLAPSLAGVGARYSPGQLRLRVVDPRLVNPQSFMPAFHSTANLSRVGRAWQDKPIFSPQQVEDVVAWLSTLR